MVSLRRLRSTCRTVVRPCGCAHTEDVPALRHRVILSYEALADGVAADAIVDAVVAHVGSPSKEVEALG